MSNGSHVLLTGPPGIGKTTLVRKVVEELLKRKQNVSGFYTEEVRDVGAGKRTGFQVVTLDGKRATLSSIHSKSTLRVGNYGVELSEFEAVAIPSITQNFANEPGGSSGFLVIDEIGKMELFSSKFKDAVTKAYGQTNTLIIATIPIPKGKPIPFVDNIRKMPCAKLITVDRANRDGRVEDVINALMGK